MYLYATLFPGMAVTLPFHLADAHTDSTHDAARSDHIFAITRIGSLRGTGDWHSD
ncbi:hypothetical protein GCM10010981_04610 [Dyella nitratireducens]|uniref:Uncharacterized protein n=1 Tax=Dyella nitratireducens TaxID=1849580 RepID=A0ABQ1FLN4_9GAMM|nr:hypothetical protein GCM10010981_04610 [Dyella nitratireducens]GLQ44477.1 hypothetical protein GCM10007902_43270 [Dyella nitratireducens]